MIIKDKKIINTGIKLFNDVHRFKYACSEYFKLKYKGMSHESIKEYLGFVFQSSVSKTVKYSGIVSLIRCTNIIRSTI